jgi:hypothetical protein
MLGGQGCGQVPVARGDNVGCRGQGYRGPGPADRFSERQVCAPRKWVFGDGQPRRTTRMQIPGCAAVLPTLEPAGSPENAEPQQAGSSSCAAGHQEYRPTSVTGTARRQVAVVGRRGGRRYASRSQRRRRGMARLAVAAARRRRAGGRWHPPGCPHRRAWARSPSPRRSSLPRLRTGVPRRAPTSRCNGGPASAGPWQVRRVGPVPARQRGRRLALSAVLRLLRRLDPDCLRQRPRWKDRAQSPPPATRKCRWPDDVWEGVHTVPGASRTIPTAFCTIPATPWGMGPRAVFYEEPARTGGSSRSEIWSMIFRPGSTYNLSSRVTSPVDDHPHIKR